MANNDMQRQNYCHCLCHTPQGKEDVRPHRETECFCMKKKDQQSNNQNNKKRL